MPRANLLILIMTLLASFPATAQPIESEPLPAPYTMQGETDPMATGSAPATPAPDIQKNINRGEAIIAPPPPGADDYTAGIPDASETPADSTVATPQPAQDNVVPNYPNNAVSGVPPQDTSKFEKMTFCTLKITFAAADAKTNEKIKTYLDSNADKFTYKHAPEGKKEQAYCLDITEHNNRAKTYTALKKIIQNSDGKTSATLTGKGFAPVRR